MAGLFSAVDKQSQQWAFKDYSMTAVSVASIGLEQRGRVIYFLQVQVLAGRHVKFSLDIYVISFSALQLFSLVGMYLGLGSPF